MNTNKVTITRKEFKGLAAKVIADVAAKDSEKADDPMFGMFVMMNGVSILSKIENELFGKEDNYESDN